MTHKCNTNSPFTKPGYCLWPPGCFLLPPSLPSLLCPGSPPLPRPLGAAESQHVTSLGRRSLFIQPSMRWGPTGGRGSRCVWPGKVACERFLRGTQLGCTLYGKVWNVYLQNLCTLSRPPPRHTDRSTCMRRSRLNNMQTARFLNNTCLQPGQVINSLFPSQCVSRGYEFGDLSKIQ